MTGEAEPGQPLREAENDRSPHTADPPIGQIRTEKLKTSGIKSDNAVNLKALSLIMKKKLKSGDLLSFPVSESNSGYGQILHSDIIQYIVIFEPKLKRDISLDEVLSSLPLLQGWTMDARIWSGQWHLVGHARPIWNIELFEFKLELEGRMWVTDLNGNRLRLATPDEVTKLKFHRSYSPIAFEKAFKAYHGLLPWEERFDSLLSRVNIH